MKGVNDSVDGEKNVAYQQKHQVDEKENKRTTGQGSELVRMIRLWI